MYDGYVLTWRISFGLWQWCAYLRQTSFSSIAWRSAGGRNFLRKELWSASIRVLTTCKPQYRQLSRPQDLQPWNLPLLPLSSGLSPPFSLLLSFSSTHTSAYSSPTAYPNPFTRIHYGSRFEGGWVVITFCSYHQYGLLWGGWVLWGDAGVKECLVLSSEMKI